MQIIRHGQEVLHGLKIKMVEIGLLFLREGEGVRIWWPNKDHITAEGDSVGMYIQFHQIWLLWGMVS